MVAVRYLYNSVGKRAPLEGAFSTPSALQCDRTAPDFVLVSHTAQLPVGLPGHQQVPCGDSRFPSLQDSLRKVRDLNGDKLHTVPYVCQYIRIFLFGGVQLANNQRIVKMPLYYSGDLNNDELEYEQFWSDTQLLVHYNISYVRYALVWLLGTVDDLCL